MIKAPTTLRRQHFTWEKGIKGKNIEYIVRRMNMRSNMIGKIKVIRKSFKYAPRKYTNDGGSIHTKNRLF